MLPAVLSAVLTAVLTASVSPWCWDYAHLKALCDDFHVAAPPHGATFFTTDLNPKLKLRSAHFERVSHLLEPLITSPQYHKPSVACRQYPNNFLRPDNTPSTSGTGGSATPK